MKVFSEKFNHKDYVLDLELFYMMTLSDEVKYLYHTFFVVKDNEVLKEYPEEIINVVQNYVNDIFENKLYKLINND
ncbi:MAG: hypothetical protein HC836_47465 [Richelia sp. RM2_1_2]|nr:hypothetical protein [Richelia sp. RM2_1_2]